MERTTTAQAIVYAALLLAAVYVGMQFLIRQQTVIEIPNSTSFYRVDKWTGDVELCSIERASGSGLSKLALRCVTNLP